MARNIVVDIMHADADVGLGWCVHVTSLPDCLLRGRAAISGGGGVGRTIGNLTDANGRVGGARRVYTYIRVRVVSCRVAVARRTLCK